MPGNIEVAMMNESARFLPRNLRRASAYADKMAMMSTSTVTVPATKTLLNSARPKWFAGANASL